MHFAVALGVDQDDNPTLQQAERHQACFAVKLASVFASDAVPLLSPEEGVLEPAEGIAAGIGGGSLLSAVLRKDYAELPCISAAFRRLHDDFATAS